MARGCSGIQIPAGAYCSGSWNVRDPNPVTVVSVNCDDGAKGESVIARQPDLMSGTAIVALSNKKRGQFMFGDSTYVQSFGTGAAGTHRVPPVLGFPKPAPPATPARRFTCLPETGIPDASLNTYNI